MDKEELALIAKLHQKKLKVLTEMERVPKNGRNSFHNYDYALESDIVDHIRRQMTAAGLSYSASVVGEPKRDGQRTTILLNLTLIDTETGYSETVQWYGDGEDKADKGIYKAYTGAQKYALMKTFLVSTGDDPEETEQEQGGKPPRPATRPQQVNKEYPHKSMQVTSVGARGQVAKPQPGSASELGVAKTEPDSEDPRHTPDAALWGIDKKTGQIRSRATYEGWLRNLNKSFSDEMIAQMDDTTLKKIVREELDKQPKKQGAA